VGRLLIINQSTIIMKKTHPNNTEKRQIIFLSLSTFICLCLSLFRMYYTKTFTYFFLNWNLLLAIIPWILSRLAIHNQFKHRFYDISLICIWLLFFPNAPYILTDLFHLKLHSTVPIWFDLVLILSFAWVGLIAGFISLSNIGKIICVKFNVSNSGIYQSILLFISSFGIYLGRFLRWNSWDIIAQPHQLIHDIFIRFAYPFDHPATWGMTITMGLFLNLSFWSFKFLNHHNSI